MGGLCFFQEKIVLCSSRQDYLLRSALPSEGDKEELAELEVFLDERIRQAEDGKISKRTVGEIFQQAYQEADGQNPS